MTPELKLGNEVTGSAIWVRSGNGSVYLDYWTFIAYAVIFVFHFRTRLEFVGKVSEGDKIERP